MMDPRMMQQQGLFGQRPQPQPMGGMFGQPLPPQMGGGGQMPMPPGQGMPMMPGMPGQGPMPLGMFTGGPAGMPMPTQGGGGNVVPDGGIPNPNPMPVLPTIKQEFGKGGGGGGGKDPYKFDTSLPWGMEMPAILQMLDQQQRHAMRGPTNFTSPHFDIGKVAGKEYAGKGGKDGGGGSGGGGGGSLGGEIVGYNKLPDGFWNWSPFEQERYRKQVVKGYK